MEKRKSHHPNIAIKIILALFVLHKHLKVVDVSFSWPPWVKLQAAMDLRIDSAKGVQTPKDFTTSGMKSLPSLKSYHSKH